MPQRESELGNGVGRGSAGSVPDVVVAPCGRSSTRLARVAYSKRLFDLFDLESLQVDALGACGVEPFTAVRASIESRVETHQHGGLRFTFADPATATDVSTTHPWAQSLVVAGRSYVPAAGRPRPAAGMGHVARFASVDHYEPLRRSLASIAGALRRDGLRAEILCDDNRLVDRAAAVRAGLGWWGKSTMVIAPRLGPWMLFGSVVTDATFQPTTAMVRDCGTCEACIPACPTGALDTPGVLDARRCLAAILQRPGTIPARFRRAVGDRFYGCDECLVACPPGQRLEGEAGDDAGVDLVRVLETTDEQLLATFDHFYIPRRDPRYLRRNALVALGNTGSAAHVPVLIEYLNHRSGLLRLHAAWALGEIGGADALGALQERLDVETVAEVRAEIEHARASE